MAVYKVPQDVEAEDKLLGPLTFKQFIFLMVAAGAAMFAWLLFTIQPVLVLLPLPIMLIFGGLAVFRREDQPVERYLLSFFNYMLRPRVRVWSTEGHYEHLVITAPKKKAPPPLKRNVREVHGQLEKLAQIVDSRGWALKQPAVISPGQQPADVDDRLFIPETPLETDEAPEESDIMDDSNPEAAQLDSMLEETSRQQREELLARVKEEASNPQPKSTPENIHYDPYGSSMSHQKRINPDGTGNIHQKEEEKAQQPQENQEPHPVDTAPASSDIMDLSGELKVSQIADRVNRDQDDLREGEEIQLR